MTDVFDKTTRSYVMSQIKSKDTKPEMVLRQELWNRGLRYRIHRKDVFNADIVFPKEKLAIFVDGEFWHGYNWMKLGKIPPEGYWQEKIRRNIERDKRINDMLKQNGWQVLRFWESEVIKFSDDCVKKIIGVLKGK